MTTFNQPYIRDKLTIDNWVQKYYDECTGDGPVLLLGRIVKHAQTLRVYRQPLIIVADLYDGTNGIIDARGLNSGAGGAQGGGGAHPWPGYDHFTGAPTGPGGEGGSGGAGGPGAHAPAVTVYCRRSVNANVLAAGGNGAPGGSGGPGGRGVDGFIIPDQTVWVDDTPDNLSNFSGHEEFIPGGTVDGTPGGNGGGGGNGGAGGNGGTVKFTSIVDDTFPTLDVRGGGGGPGGAGGAPGIDGNLSASQAGEGSFGAEGAFGADGQAIHANVSEAEYIAGLRSVLDFPAEGWSYANHWAPYRIVVGDYFYHKYNPSAPGREWFGKDAAIEFTRALELQPDNTEALRLQAQLVGYRQEMGADDFIWVGGGNNALGLPRELDVQPDVKTYMDSFVLFSDFSVDFLSMGMSQLLESVTLGQFTALANFHLQQAIHARDNLQLDVGIAVSEKRLAGDEANRVQQLLDQTTADIQAALEEMEESELSIGDIVGTVASVAVAVVGVVAAIPSGGASLVALVPAMVALADTTIQQGGPIATAVFDGKSLDSNAPEVKRVKEEYEKFDKKAEAVIKAGKSIVNFVEVVKKLTASTTPDNSKHMALVRRGADLAYQVLLARNKVTLAQQRIDAAQSKLARAAAIVDVAEQMTKDFAQDEERVRRTALSTIGVVQSKADALLRMAFRAQRSVEIYTLESVERHLLLDAGLIHPDDWLRYLAKEIKEPELLSKLQQTWLQLLEPVGIQQQYLSYFAKQHDLDVLRLSFRVGDPEFGQLLTTRRLAFRVEATEIPAERDDAKVTGVRLALVGASHPANEVSCDVRHGAKYEQRRGDGSIAVQELKSLVNNRVARLQSLGGDGGLSTDPEPPDVGSLAFWGRGIGGDWEVSIPGSQFNSELDLSGLTEIQVWIGYRFLR
jgi:hypothetical protein